MQDKNDSALYIGPSHAEGGIPVIVDPNKPGEHPVEVEGIEYKICAEAYNSNEVLTFTQKTNFEILDSIHKDFSCKFNQGEADGGDFIICKVAVKDEVKRSRSGTVKQLLDEIQGENGCRLSNGQIAQKAKQGGVVKSRPIFFGSITWDNEIQFLGQYAIDEIAICEGVIDFKNGSYFYLRNSQNFDLAQIETGKADLYNISKLNIANTAKAATKILNKAIQIPGNTISDLEELLGAILSNGNLESGKINEFIFDHVKSIATAGKILGFDGILLWSDHDFTQTTAFIWNIKQIVPLIVSNEKNYSHLKKLGNCGCEHKEEGGTLKKSESENGTGYDARVAHNLSQMNAPFEEWRATPIIGTTEVEINGKVKKMPLFDFPKGYTIAPTLYLANEDNACCGLCGKDPISNWYWIQNDSKKWSLGVGSECVTHFGEGKSGKELERELKVNTAKDFDAKLYELALWVKKNFYKGPDYPNCSPLLCSSYMQSWQNLWDVKTTYTMDRTFSALYIYNPLLPFDYLKQLDKAIKKGADADTARKATEKKLLLWYSREFNQKVKNISNTLQHLKSQPENFLLQNGYAASEREQVAWLNRAKEFQQLAGDYIEQQKKLVKGGEIKKYIASPKISGWVKITGVSADDVTELLNSDLVVVNKHSDGDRIKYYDPNTKSTLDFGKYDDGYHLIGCCDYGWGSTMPGNKATAELKAAIAKLNTIRSAGKPTKKSIDEAWDLIRPEIEKVKKEFPGSHDFNWWRSRVNEFFYQGKLKALSWGVKNATEKLFPEVWAAYKYEINPSAPKNELPLDFKSVDMQADYDRLNREMFSGELSPVPLKWIHQKYKIGVTVFRPDGSVDYAAVSNFYNITRQQYLDVLAHEMIHVWMAQKGLREPNHHGTIFMSKLEELNAKFPEFKITKTENAADYNISGMVKPKEYGVVLFDEDGGSKYSIVVVNADVLNIKPAIEQFIAGMKKHGALHFKNLKLKFYKSSHPDLAKFKVKKSLSLRSMEVFVLTDEMAGEIQQDDPTREVDFTIKKELPIAQIEAQLPEELLVYHRSPVRFEHGRPHFDAFFGTKGFSETFKEDFGKHLYVARVPETMRKQMLDLNKDTPEARLFMVAVAEQVYPTDKNYHAELLNGDKQAIKDFYEIWTDKNQILPEMRKRGIQIAAFHDEYLLTKEAVAKLDFSETETSLSKEKNKTIPELKTEGFLSMLVADINENVGRVQEYTYKRIDKLADKVNGIKKQMAALPKRDLNKGNLQKEIDLLYEQKSRLEIDNENRFFKQTAEVDSLLRKFSLENKLLTADETNSESDDWQDLLAAFWMAVLERPGTEAYWENTAEFVWRDVVLDYRLGKNFAPGKAMTNINVQSAALGKILPEPVAGLSEYLMLRSSGNTLLFAGYQTNSENAIEPSWQISIKNDHGVLDQQEINKVFDLRAKVVIREGVTTIILPYDITQTDYKRAYTHFEVIKNELIDYRIRLKELFLKAQKKEENLKTKNPIDQSVVIFRSSYPDFYLAFHGSAEILHRELNYPIYNVPVLKYEQNDFVRPINQYTVFKSALLPEVKKLKKQKNISVFVAEEPMFGYTTAKQLISFDEDELGRKLKTLLALLRQ